MVKNKQVNFHWAICTGENFNLLSDCKAYVPSLNGSSMCLKFHILGSCASNCPLVVIHVPLTGDVSTQMSEFIKTCHDSAPPAMSGGATGSAPPLVLNLTSFTNELLGGGSYWFL